MEVRTVPMHRNESPGTRVGFVDGTHRPPAPPPQDENRLEPRVCVRGFAFGSAAVLALCPQKGPTGTAYVAAPSSLDGIGGRSLASRLA
jgi:hypothetical protein